jgi:phytoene dehydrogenase-like protein
MTDNKTACVIGAGHNGLVCAAYLAKAGYSVTILEAASDAGGAAASHEFAPGYRSPGGAHLLHGLNENVVRDLALEKHGLALAAKNLKTLALGESGNHLVIDGASASGAEISEADMTAFPQYLDRMHKFAGVLRGVYQRCPPRLGGRDWRDAVAGMQMGLDMRRMGTEDMREFLRIAGINIYDVLQEQFDSDLLKGALALDAVLGVHLGPRSNNSVLTALHRMTGDWPAVGGSALPTGGMAGLVSALVAAATQAGATLRTNAQVASIILDGDRAVGVRLEDGEEIPAALVVSGADPRRTFLDLVGARHLEAGFVHRISNIRMRGDAARLHLGLDRAPSFTGIESGDLGQRLVIAPDLDYVEKAFDHAKYGEYSSEPALEITLPSVHEPSLAPAGHHVLSAIVQYAPYDLKTGWDTGRKNFMDQVMDQIERYAPGIRDAVVAAELMAPPDIEARFGMTGGHWHHGEIALDQFLMMRPVPGAGQYQTPVPGLFLCGAGAHPGGGVMGLAGRNAAQRIIAKGGAA